MLRFMIASYIIIGWWSITMSHWGSLEVVGEDKRQYDSFGDTFIYQGLLFSYLILLIRIRIN